MFSHHSLIRSRTNHHQKSILPASTITIKCLHHCCYHRRNQPQPKRTSLKQAKSTRAYHPKLVHSCQPWISNTKISSVFFLFLIFALLVSFYDSFALVFCMLFSFSFGSMILQSSLEVVTPPGFEKRSHFNFLFPM